MSMTTDAHNAVALVARGFDEPTRCLHFRVGFYRDAEHALQALRLIGDYNAFDGEAVAQAVAPFLDVVQEAEVGRESSPVLYLTLGYDAVSEFRHTIEAALRGVYADELDWTGDTLRAWWD